MTNNLSKCINCGCEKSKTLVSGIEDFEFGVKGSWSYSQCQNCYLAKLYPFPDMYLLKKAYPKEYVDNNSKNSSSYFSKLLQRLYISSFSKKYARILRGKRVLDVGCGAGKLSSLLKKQFDCEVVGLDFSEDVRYCMNDQGIEVVIGLFCDYRPIQKFDVIVMNNYIEHTLNPVLELKHAFCLLNPGGKIIGLLPNLNGLDRILLGRYWGGYHCPRHTYQFTPNVLGDILKKSGFKDIKIKNEYHAAHLSIGLSNLYASLVGVAKPNQNEFRRIPFFALITTILSFVSAPLALIGKNGAMNFEASKYEAVEKNF